MLAWITALIMTGLFVSGIAGMGTAPAHAEVETPTNDTDTPCFVILGCSADCDCIECFYMVSLYENAEQFDALFNGYETRWSKNGRLMIRTGNSGPYKFVRKAA